MLHIDDDDGDDDADHYLLEVVADKVTLRMMVEFVGMGELVELNLMDAYFHPYHSLIVVVVDDDLLLYLHDDILRDD